ncbi:MAG: hypothetical protein KDK78_02515 [Chlamydiia bacterium]|nr:hypothetical protein [Chlamydiia bacterium]
MDDVEDLELQAINALMQEHDGVNPNAPIPVDVQLENQRQIYRRRLQMQEERTWIQQAMKALRVEFAPSLGPSESDFWKQIRRNTDDLEEGKSPTLELDHTYQEAVLAFVKDVAERQDDALALSLFYLLTQLMPNAPTYWEGLGLVFLKLERYPEAAAAFANLVDCEADNPMAWLLLAEATTEANEASEAAAVLEAFTERFVDANLAIDEDAMALYQSLASRNR